MFGTALAGVFFVISLSPSISSRRKNQVIITWYNANCKIGRVERSRDRRWLVKGEAGEGLTCQKRTHQEYTYTYDLYNKR